MTITRNRKQLPNFGVLNNYKVDIEQLLKFCFKNNYFDTDLYNDINVSSNSFMKGFVIANEFCKESFFKDSSEEYLESQVYKQRYLTELHDNDLLQARKDYVQENHVPIKSTIMSRTRRLDSSSKTYKPEADEHNYGKKNELVIGEVEKVLNMFKGKLARVRFAYLAPNFSLKPHIDYDPSYITRFHIPLITNKKCLMGVKKKNVEYRTHFPADGRVYFLNAGHIHWAENNSNVNRIHLIVDTQNQDDLQDLTEYNNYV